MESSGSLTTFVGYEIMFYLLLSIILKQNGDSSVKHGSCSCRPQNSNDNHHSASCLPINTLLHLTHRLAVTYHRVVFLKEW